MANRVPLAASVALGCTLLAGAALAGCGRGSDQAKVPPTRPPSRIKVEAEATPTARPTTEDEAARSAAATLAAAPAAVETVTTTEQTITLLPTDPDAVIVQLARIEPSPWEPQILAQMRPHFSLQASGFGVFHSPSGDSETAWYQTVMTPTSGLAFLRLLVDEIGVLDLASRHGVAEADYRTDRLGAPAGTDVLGVIYVHGQGKEGRLVIPEATMEEPPAGPDHDRLVRLHSVILALEVWKQGLFHDFSPEEKMAVGSALGWWSDVRLPFTPESGVAYGSRARANIPGDPAAALWPLGAPALAEAFDAPYGSEPAELLLRGAELAAVLGADLERPASFWGPLWRSGADSDLHLVGVRAAVPGSNQCVVDYTYKVPLRSIRPSPATEQQ